MLRHLGDNVVIDAAVGDRARSSAAAGWRLTEEARRARGDLLLSDTELQRLGAIDIHLVGGVIQWLRDADVGDARNALHPILEPQRDVVIFLQVIAGNLHVDCRRQAEVQYLADDIGGLEVKVTLGNFAPSILANLRLVHPRSGGARL